MPQEIKGYRDLSPEEIALINRIKTKAEEVGKLVYELNQWASTDKRWVAEGKTDLQKGFMSLTRAVAQPESF